jgi:hypothetical protein
MALDVHRKLSLRTFRRSALLAIGAALLLGATAGSAAAMPGANSYRRLNLVSDIPGVAKITDPNLVNPWGLAAGSTTPLWVADNGTNVSTLYSGGVNGSPPTIVPLVVKIQGRAPTGTVFNPTSDFVVKTSAGSGPATFICSSR